MQQHAVAGNVLEAHGHAGRLQPLAQGLGHGQDAGFIAAAAVDIDNPVQQILHGLLLAAQPVQQSRALLHAALFEGIVHGGISRVHAVLHATPILQHTLHIQEKHEITIAKAALLLPQRLAQQGAELTASEQTLAQTLGSDYPHALLESATALAARTGTSASTVVRLFAKLGYASYAEAQREARGEVTALLQTAAQRAPAAARSAA